jgi:hypothetical protein
VFQWFKLQEGCNGYALEGLEIALDPATQYGLYVLGASDIEARGLIVHQADDRTLSGVGVFVRYGRRVKITGSQFFWLESGINSLDSAELEITGNTFRDLQADGSLHGGLKGGRISNNQARNFFTAGVHPDFIQFTRSYESQQPCENIDVEDNHFERDHGDPIQGIFDEDSIGLNIRRNALIGTMPNGISLARSQHCEVTQNFVQSYPDVEANILVRQHADHIDLVNNSAPVYVGVAGEPQPTDIYQENNVPVPAASGPGDHTEYDKWLASLTPDDPCQEYKDRIVELENQIAVLDDQLAIANGKIEDAIAVLSS